MCKKENQKADYRAIYLFNNPHYYYYYIYIFTYLYNNKAYDMINMYKTNLCKYDF